MTTLQSISAVASAVGAAGTPCPSQFVAIDDTQARRQTMSRGARTAGAKGTRSGVERPAVVPAAHSDVEGQRSPRVCAAIEH